MNLLILSRNKFKFLWNRFQFDRCKNYSYSILQSLSYLISVIANLSTDVSIHKYTLIFIKQGGHSKLKVKFQYIPVHFQVYFFIFQYTKKDISSTGDKIEVYGVIKNQVFSSIIVSNPYALHILFSLIGFPLVHSLMKSAMRKLDVREIWVK